MALSVLILTKVDPPPRATATTPTPAMVREKREVVHVSNQHVAADDDAVAMSDVRRRTHVQ